jgi:energy-coupling factor transport system permease protein
MMYHTLAWLIWLLAAAVPAFTVRNPTYLVLTLGAAWIVYSALGRTSPLGSSWGGFIKLGLVLLALTIPFNALSNHAGTIVLFRLPPGWPIVGGPITLEAAVDGAANGLGLLTILVVFAAFNATVDHYQLLRATPAFLFQAGVVVSIAITFVPQMVLSAREIREAQRIRGHRVRGVRDLLPLVLPLLADSLERAIQLAETMEARGFAGVSQPRGRRQALLLQAGTLASLLGLLAGLFVAAYFGRGRPWGWGLVAASLAGLLAILWRQGQGVYRTRYRRPRWRGRDTAVAAASLGVLAAVVAAKVVEPAALAYSPYPPNALLPPFDPLIGAPLLLLALPAFLAPGTAPARSGHAPDSQPSMPALPERDPQ